MNVQKMGPRVDTEGMRETVARRSGVLGALDGATLSKPDLEERLHISRSTIDRAIRELETAGLVERAEGSFTATTTGRLAIREYESLASHLDSVELATRLLDHVPFGDAPTPAALEGAEYHWPEPPEPGRVLDPIVDILERSESFRAFSRAVSDPELLGDIQREVVEGGLDVEFVYSESMIEHLRSSYVDQLSAVRAQENFRMFVTESLPFGLGVAHGRELGPQLVLIAYGQDGKLRGVLYNDTPAAIAWGEDVFRRYRREATEL